MITDVERLRDRYERDSAFHMLVDVLTAQIIQLRLAPSEIREAAMYAVYRAEILYPPTRFVADEDVRRALRRADERVGAPTPSEESTLGIGARVYFRADLPKRVAGTIVAMAENGRTREVEWDRCPERPQFFRWNQVSDLEPVAALKQSREPGEKP